MRKTLLLASLVFGASAFAAQESGVEVNGLAVSHDVASLYINQDGKKVVLSGNLDERLSGQLNSPDQDLSAFCVGLEKSIACEIEHDGANSGTIVLLEKGEKNYHVAAGPLPTKGDALEGIIKSLDPKQPFAEQLKVALGKASGNPQVAESAKGTPTDLRPKELPPGPPGAGGPPLLCDGECSPTRRHRPPVVLDPCGEADDCVVPIDPPPIVIHRRAPVIVEEQIVVTPIVPVWQVYRFYRYGQGPYVPRLIVRRPFRRW